MKIGRWGKLVGVEMKIGRWGNLKSAGGRNEKWSVGENENWQVGANGAKTDGIGEMKQKPMEGNKNLHA